MKEVTLIENMPRAKLTLENFVNITLSNLCAAYIGLNSAATEQGFKDEFLTPVILNDNLTGDFFFCQMVRHQSEQPALNSRHIYIVISCAFCVQSKKALDKGDRELAWSYMADARYWCGLALAGRFFEASLDKYDEIYREKPGRGAKKRAEKNYGAVIAKAQSLAREMKPQGSLWPSLRNAATSIEKAVLQFNTDEINNSGPDRPPPRRLSVHQAVSTISGWLAKMPDKESFIKSPAKKSASRR